MSGPDNVQNVLELEFSSERLNKGVFKLLFVY